MELSRVHKPKKKKKWLRILLLTISLLLLGTGAYAYSLYKSTEAAVGEMHEPIKREKSVKREEVVAVEKLDPISFLILGVDERKGDSGRSDTMVVLTVNPTKKSMQMMSIPRDTRVNIVGYGSEDKINHAYAYGGVEMAIDTVEEFLDIPIDYYVKVNMESFKEIVDAVGGITVNNTLSFNFEGSYFPEGQIELNGTKALKYARMRKLDPNGDFGRQDRQKEVIQAVIKKGASLGTLGNFQDILDAISQNIKTNLTFDEMKDIQAEYREAIQNVEQLNIQGEGQMMGVPASYFYIVSDANRQAISDRLKLNLEIE